MLMATMASRLGRCNLRVKSVEKEEILGEGRQYLYPLAKRVAAVCPNPVGLATR